MIRFDHDPSKQSGSDFLNTVHMRVTPVGSGVVGDEVIDKGSPGEMGFCVSPGTPSSALGTSIPCQCTVMGILNLLFTVTSTTFPCCTESWPRRAAIEGQGLDGFSLPQMECLGLCDKDVSHDWGVRAGCN